MFQKLNVWQFYGAGMNKSIMYIFAGEVIVCANVELLSAFMLVSLVPISYCDNTDGILQLILPKRKNLITKLHFYIVITKCDNDMLNTRVSPNKMNVNTCTQLSTKKWLPF